MHFYNARWYDSSLSRFAQADSVLPGAGKVQAYDRYAYSLNNPIKYVDPDGHESKDPCSYYGYGTAACPQSSPYAATPTAAPTAIQMSTMNVHCGIRAPGDLASSGLGCGPGGGQGDNQMTIWGSSSFGPLGLDFDFQYQPYPGYRGAPTVSQDNGKALQSKDSYNATRGISSVVNVGYSAGVDAAVFATEQRAEAGLQTQALVLLGPTYLPGTIAVDYRGTDVTVDNLVDRIANLSQHTPVLMVDDTGQYKALFQERYPNANITFVDPLNPEHTAIDDTPYILEQTANWLLAIGVR